MHTVIAEHGIPEIKDPTTKFLETFIENQPNPSCENAQNAGFFCKENDIDIFTHLHGLINSPNTNDHQQCANIMHHLGITAPHLCSKTSNKNVAAVSEKIKDHLGPQIEARAIKAIRTERFKSFDAAYTG